MSLQWTAVAGLLYFELFLTLLFLVITSEKITLGSGYNIRRGGNLLPISQNEISKNRYQQIIS